MTASTTVVIDGREHAVVDQLRPGGARGAILDEVLAALGHGQTSTASS